MATNPTPSTNPTPVPPSGRATSVRWTEEQIDDVEKWAAFLGISRSTFIRSATMKTIKALSQRKSAMEANQAAEEFADQEAQIQSIAS